MLIFAGVPSAWNGHSVAQVNANCLGIFKHFFFLFVHMKMEVFFILLILISQFSHFTVVQLVIMQKNNCQITQIDLKLIWK